MRVLVLILGFLFFGSSHGQGPKVKVDYSVQFEGDFLSEEQQQDAGLVDMMKGIESRINAITFVMLYENGTSFFKADEQTPVANETISGEMARIFTSQDNIFVQDVGAKTVIINQDVNGKRYNVVKDMSAYGWQLKPETKMIEGYSCSKAILQDKRRNKEIVAWYCPKIAFNAGPIEYGNLPGLILELEIGKLKYVAKSIELDYKGSLKIELPNDKKINEKELDSITRGF